MAERPVVLPANVLVGDPTDSNTYVFELPASATKTVVAIDGSFYDSTMSVSTTPGGTASSNAMFGLGGRSKERPSLTRFRGATFTVGVLATFAVGVLVTFTLPVIAGRLVTVVGTGCAAALTTTTSLLACAPTSRAPNRFTITTRTDSPRAVPRYILKRS